VALNAIKETNMPINRGRTIVFIDNSNIFGGQHAVGWRLDWEKLIAHIGENGEIWQVHFFGSENDPPRAIQTGFYRHLKEDLNWEVHLYTLGRKTVRCSQCTHSETTKAEKGVDVGLATKMLTLGVNRAYDTAILVAGDRDFLETVQFVKGLGLRVEIIGWRGAMSRELEAESSSKVIYLDDLKDKVEKD
jgi:uncharacterized LabA/DUF88 family protein